mmetsp:Transcript_82070/g.100693  ORF Transcript_82070/g.100693 Transcript_82070/m.100693 type:complete len:165 (+) Transcript_82070:36-530(+)
MSFWNIDFVMPIAGILINTKVTIDCIREVHKLQELYGINESNIKSNKRDYNRALTCKTECINRSIVTTSVFIIGTIFLKPNNIHNKIWPLRIFGILSILNALSRKNYANTFRQNIQDSLQFLHKSNNIMQISYIMAFGSCIYLIYKDVSLLSNKYLSNSILLSK